MVTLHEGCNANDAGRGRVVRAILSITSLETLELRVNNRFLKDLNKFLATPSRGSNNCLSKVATLSVSICNTLVAIDRDFNNGSEWGSGASDDGQLDVVSSIGLVMEEEEDEVLFFEEMEWERVGQTENNQDQDHMELSEPSSVGMDTGSDTPMTMAQPACVRNLFEMEIGSPNLTPPPTRSLRHTTAAIGEGDWRQVLQYFHYKAPNILFNDWVNDDVRNLYGSRLLATAQWQQDSLRQLYTLLKRLPSIKNLLVNSLQLYCCHQLLCGVPLSSSLLEFLPRHLHLLSRLVLRAIDFSPSHSHTVNDSNGTSLGDELSFLIRESKCLVSLSLCSSLTQSTFHNRLLEILFRPNMQDRLQSSFGNMEEIQLGSSGSMEGLFPAQITALFTTFHLPNLVFLELSLIGPFTDDFIDALCRCHLLQVLKIWQAKKWFIQHAMPSTEPSSISSSSMARLGDSCALLSTLSLHAGTTFHAGVIATLPRFRNLRVFTIGNNSVFTSPALPGEFTKALSSLHNLQELNVATLSFRDAQFRCDHSLTEMDYMFAESKDSFSGMAIGLRVSDIMRLRARFPSLRINERP
jgi:hypothetical protein